MRYAVIEGGLYRFTNLAWQTWTAEQANGGDAWDLSKRPGVKYLGVVKTVTDWSRTDFATAHAFVVADKRAAEIEIVCKACAERTRRGFEGLCPQHTSERARREMHTARLRGEDPRPACLAMMGCLCACHAAGLDPRETCDTNKQRARDLSGLPPDSGGR